MIPETPARSKFVSSVALFAILFGLYALVFQGHYLSIDELYIYDSAESLIQRGNLRLNYTFDVEGFSMLPVEAISEHGSPWLSPNHEPLMPVLVAPLVGLALRLPEVGTLHAVWFFNLFVTGLTAVSLYLIGMRRGYSRRVAWLGGLLFGISTIAAYYSQLLFREPLFGLLLLWGFALAAEVGDDAQSVRWRTAVLLVVCCVLAVLTKILVTILLPSLLILLLPALWAIGRRHIGWIALGGAGGVVFAILLSANAFGERYSMEPYWVRLQNMDWEFVLESVLGNNIGPSRSLWFYSPVLLLGLPGAWLLWREGRRRVVVSMALAVLAFSAAYGMSHAYDWMGGWGWGPRYLLPLIPILMLFWVFPAMERLHTRRWGLALILLLAAAGVVVQVVGMAVPLSNYYTDVFFAGEYYDYEDFVIDDLHWLGLNWKMEWSPLYYHLDRLDFLHLNFAWRFAERPLIPVAFGLALVLLGSIRTHLWEGLRRRLAYVVLVMGLVLAFMGTALLSLRDDARYIQDWPDVRELMERLNDKTSGGDVIFVDQRLYTDVVMNTQKTPAVIAILPYAAVEFVTDEGVDWPPAEQIGAGTVAAFNWVPGHFDGLWLVTRASPFVPELLRPVERYLAARYFMAEEIGTSSSARAILYLPFAAPSGPPETEANAVFGDQVRLAGFDLPAGAQISSSPGLPVSLVWEAVGTVEFDYSVGVMLVDAGGVVVAQHDGPPQGTFGRMTAWETGQQYRDNHGLEDVPPGEYRLLVVVYNWQTGERLLLEDGSDSYELGTITVR